MSQENVEIVLGTVLFGAERIAWLSFHGGCRSHWARSLARRTPTSKGPSRWLPRKLFAKLSDDLGHH